MELIDTINNRRSIRAFKKQEIAKEIIEDLVNCARLAPSAKNRQPWKFVIVKDEMKNKIANIMLEVEERAIFNPNEKQWHTSVKRTAKIIKEAPILILVLKNQEDDWKTGDTLSIGAAIEHICLCATDSGLGSLWIRDTVFAQKEIAKEIGHQDMEMICAIAIGYPNENPGQRPRKNLSEILEWYE